MLALRVALDANVAANPDGSESEPPVCTKQMCSVRDNWSRYQQTGAEVVGVNTDLGGEAPQLRGEPQAADTSALGL
jgi:AhpC/TSA family